MRKYNILSRNLNVTDVKFQYFNAETGRPEEKNVRLFGKVDRTTAKEVLMGTYPSIMTVIECENKKVLYGCYDSDFYNICFELTENRTKKACQTSIDVLKIF